MEPIHLNTQNEVSEVNICVLDRYEFLRLIFDVLLLTNRLSIFFFLLSKLLSLSKLVNNLIRVVFEIWYFLNCDLLALLEGIKRCIFVFENYFQITCFLIYLGVSLLDGRTWAYCLIYYPQIQEYLAKSSWLSFYLMISSFH